MSYNICAGFTFYGYIPDGSDSEHLGIILGVKDELLKYCYCTSKFSKILNNIDHIKISADKMKVYFSNPKDTYIFLSTRHILDMFVITFKSRLDSEYEVKTSINKDIYIAILSKIQNSDNLPERFKSDFFKFLE